jgi:UDPglucose 6-dehydrogenase
MSVIGTGYLGAVHAACMAHLGHEVVGYDVEASKIAALSAARSPFYEPGFDDFLAKALATNRLRFTSDPADAIRESAAHFVCVGTPQLNGSDAADVSYVEGAIKLIGDLATCDGLIVGKSTVPVGTAARLVDQLCVRSPKHTLDIAWNPEFLREGTAVEDTLRPDRLVFGVSSESAEKILLEIYHDLIEHGVPHIITTLPTAEIVKAAANAFLATKVSFINAMAEVCEIANADVVTLSRALGMDERIGSRFLNAGLGFGGGCLPKDIRAFSARAGELGAADALSFLREVDKINMRRREKTVSIARSMLDGDFLGKQIAVLGAAFKPNSDDVRDSPALNVAASMHLKGAAVRVYDPKAMPNASKQFPTLTYCPTVTDACSDVDLVVLATEWQEFLDIDPVALRSIVRHAQLLDARNAINPLAWADAGWRIFGLGRGDIAC